MDSLAIIAFFVLALSNISIAAIDDQSSSENGQFHIQTDEGDERYFKYQTISGQYRKERRLVDGTVVGSYGWVDANGYLRLRDYIADNQGYRIVKSKMVYVGAEPIGKALKMAKNAPAETGAQIYPADVNSRSKPTSVTTPRPIISPTTIPSYSTESILVNSIAPGINITPKSLSTRFNLQPTNNPIQVSVTPSLEYEPPHLTVEDNELGYEASQQRFQYQKYDKDHPNSYGSDELRKVIAARRLSGGYTPYPIYDGISTTKDGFQYYLRKQYHQEGSDGLNKAGSFGYVDPFGIRRVIYYRASPGEGFVHQKNNHFVGHDAMPFDPRPANAN